jgi:hypothetical protein
MVLINDKQAITKKQQTGVIANPNAVGVKQTLPERTNSIK